jgi:hypothetical protein
MYIILIKMFDKPLSKFRVYLQKNDMNVYAFVYKTTLWAFLIYLVFMHFFFKPEWVGAKSIAVLNYVAEFMPMLKEDSEMPTYTIYARFIRMTLFFWFGLFTVVNYAFFLHNPNYKYKVREGYENIWGSDLNCKNTYVFIIQLLCLALLGIGFIFLIYTNTLISKSNFVYEKTAWGFIGFLKDASIFMCSPLCICLCIKICIQRFFSTGEEDDESK